MSMKTIEATSATLLPRLRLLALALLMCLDGTALAACSFGEEEAVTDESADVIKAGDRLPAFDVTLADGTAASPATLSGRPSVIVFFNTACSDCRKLLPTLQTLYDETGEAASFVCISREEGAQDVAAYWAKQGLSLPYSAQTDRTVYARFATRTIPRVYVSDASGTVRTVFVEKASMKKLRAAIAAATQ